MEFAMFYEIPVARPWTPGKEHQAYKDVVEQVKLGDRLGFHSVWTVEHHFLEEFSHCSNPEVLYGHLAAVTNNIRLGYGVRLMPQPYNHPIRTAESVAVLDLLSDGRVEFGTGRSATRAELEGFGIHPNDTRSMWQEALTMTLGAMTNDEFSFEGKYWQMPTRRVLPKPLQDPHPPVWAATSSDGGHRLIGELGLGLLSFSVGTPHLKNSVAGSASIAAESSPAPNRSASSSTTVQRASQWSTLPRPTSRRSSRRVHPLSGTPNTVLI